MKAYFLLCVLFCILNCSTFGHNLDMKEYSEDICIFQGDILCDSSSDFDENHELKHSSNNFSPRTAAWDDAIEAWYKNRTKRTTVWELPIPFTIAKDVWEYRMYIEPAIKVVEYKTCVRFKEFFGKPDPSRGYIRFTSFQGSGCATKYQGYAGNIGHNILMGLTCRRVYMIAHELLHILGFEHEHARPDRDYYIMIMIKNVRRIQNFARIRVGVIPYEKFEYDPLSIMHYGLDFDALNKSVPVFIPIRKGISATAFGYRAVKYYQENVLSDDDDMNPEEDDRKHPKYKQFLSVMDRERINHVYCSNF